MKMLALPLLFVVAACSTTKAATPEPQIVTVEIPVAVPAPCVPKSFNKTPPDYVDSDTALVAAPDPASRYQLLYAGRKQRTARLGELEPIVNACPIEK